MCISTCVISMFLNKQQPENEENKLRNKNSSGSFSVVIGSTMSLSSVAIAVISVAGFVISENFVPQILSIRLLLSVAWAMISGGYWAISSSRLLSESSFLIFSATLVNSSDTFCPATRSMIFCFSISCEMFCNGNGVT
ncbi:hypothetical protein T11_16349 [Trichinella zimbabwensis]|uniref:Uncharacterized protein n=1 Tax=Trichinella zimbabwensis TaxID=268475 RepID=A0A0V1HL50_9BILA|nr:hypothetical protein T11_16349 [Trichinella zimbabwensis]